MKLIDIIMFVHNEEKYIGEQLNSLLKNMNFINKVIIVDDFSTDNTFKEISKYNNKLPIIYVKNDLRGKVNALAKGLKLVKAEYFLTCAGDDRFVDNILGRILEFLERKKTDFCYLNYFLADDKLNVISIPKKKCCYSYKDLFNKNYVGGYLFAKRKLIKDILPLNPSIPFEDWYIALKLAVKYKKVFLFNEPAFYYRRHKNATTFNIKNKQKYLYLIERDLQLFEYLKRDEYFKNYLKFIDNKILYLKMLLGKEKITLKNLLKVLFSDFIPIKDKLKLLIFKYYLNLRYR